MFLTAVKRVGAWETGVSDSAGRFSGRDTSTHGGDQYLVDWGEGLSVPVMRVYATVFDTCGAGAIYFVHPKLKKITIRNLLYQVSIGFPLPSI